MNENVSHVEEDGGEDVTTWKSIMREHVESKTRWQDLPWLDAEFYFIRVLARRDTNRKSTNFEKIRLRRIRQGLEASLETSREFSEKVKAFDANKEADLKSMI